MRWEKLFDDLNAQFDELADAEAMAELADRQRVAAGSVPMVQRCAGALGETVRVRTRGGGVHAGLLRDVGPDWVLLECTGASDVVVSLAAVTAIEGLTARTGAPLDAVAGRLDLRLVLRGVARDRAPVTVSLVGGEAHGGGVGTELSGTIDRVGRDFVEIAQHAMWEPRRASSVRSVALVPLTSIDSVRARPTG